MTTTNSPTVATVANTAAQVAARVRAEIGSKNGRAAALRMYSANIEAGCQTAADWWRAVADAIAEGDEVAA